MLDGIVPKMHTYPKVSKLQPPRRALNPQAHLQVLPHHDASDRSARTLTATSTPPQG